MHLVKKKKEVENLTFFQVGSFNDKVPKQIRIMTVGVNTQRM